ncbi:MAG TPA: head GIN domain-containing protein [Chitinophagaceae bacterium]|nr:head GIN domain-containing protein [Chitinophagaceae bacterium]
MKKLLILLAAITFGLKSFAQKTVNDANAEQRQVSGFHAISIANAFEVFITQGNEEAVAISASSSEIKERIKTTVENGVLIIRFDDDKKFWKLFNSDKQKLKAYISVKRLDKLSVSGACNVYMEEGISSGDLIIRFSGASDLKGKVNAKNLSVDLSGASDITLSGNAANLKVEASGASDFKGYELITNYCEAKASGASSVFITVNKELNATASGASDVKFKGEGLIRNIKTSGASSVSRKS